ncbi:MAG: DUF3343 domain-containing protein [Deltaproteobacteria bacterium]|nr:DUF3343 domain-containing protein [Deltaproteobacteria bacterium]
MEKILTFDGTGAALQGEEVLKEAGIPVRVMARPNSLGAQCGFCLRLDPETLEIGLKTLKASRIQVKGVYDQVQGPSGLWEYRPTLNEPNLD